MASPLLSSQFDLSASVFASKKPAAWERFSAMPKLAGVVAASRLESRPALEMVPSGIRELDLLTGGIPRGCLTEVCGAASSGRTSMLMSVLAAGTQRGEACALVDVSDAFDPMSARAAGVRFEKLLWVRCGAARVSTKNNFARKEEHLRRQLESPVEQALRVTDLLLQSGGFGLVIIDLGDAAVKVVRRIPLTSWFRFQRVVENSPTVLFVVAQAACAPACAALLLKLRASGRKLSASGPRFLGHTVPAHSFLLDGLQVEGEVLRSRMERKPVQSVTRFFTRAARAG